jgi:phage-related tail protein
VAIIQLALRQGILTAQQANDWSVRLGANGQDRKLVVTDWIAGDDLQQRVKTSTDAISAAWEHAGQAANDNAEKQQEAAQKTAQSIEQMGNSIAYSLSSLSSAFKSGDVLDILGAVVQTGVSIYGSIKGASNKTPAYADGTSFHPGGLAMVGERGPELVNLPRGAQVYPHGKGPAGMGSGVGITVTPSKYFDVAVDERVGRAAPGIADAGSRLGQMRVARSRSRSLSR